MEADRRQIDAMEEGEGGESGVVDDPRARKRVLTALEVAAWIAELSGAYALIASLLYGSGMRLGECLRLRVADIDFENGSIRVHGGNGRNERRVFLPGNLRQQLQTQVDVVRRLYRRDRRADRSVRVPVALARRLAGRPRRPGRQYLFPTKEPRSRTAEGRLRRRHLDPVAVWRVLQAAAMRAGMQGLVTRHTLRHCFARHLLDAGCDAHVLKRLLGHDNRLVSPSDSKMSLGSGADVRSPLDR